MSRSEELKYLDATALAELVRKKEVKPIELVNDTIERIEKLNPALNAVITPMYELARTAAESQLPDGPFTGVPFLLKDILASYKGVPMSMGSKVLKQHVPDHDSEIVRKYKGAGLITVGKTNTCEFGLLPTTEPEAFGATRNPWNANYSPGGSSGGSAAAVGSRMVPMSYGNDGGGSIRIPASCCGVFGLKPTRGRISMAPDFGDVMGGLVSEHAITLSVRDSAALLDATAGCLQGDPYWAPPIAQPFMREVGADAGRLRIAFSTKALMNVPIHEDCVRAVKDAALLCESLGHSVEEASPAVMGSAFADAFLVKWAAGAASIVKSLVKTLGLSQGHFEKLTWSFYELAHSYDAADYLIAEQTMHHVSRDIASFFEKYDLWLTPTPGHPPVRLGSFDPTPDNPLNGLHQAAVFSAFTAVCNATGQPAMSVPLYWNAQGLPIGAHFIGRFGDEATLFRLASQLECARPWKDRRPPLCV
jgi:amidase